LAARGGGISRNSAGGEPSRIRGVPVSNDVERSDHHVGRKEPSKTLGPS
jgi:hypothetical protein